MDKQEFLYRFKKIVDDTWELFRHKNEQYGTEDPFANFRTGAALKWQSVNYPGMYTALQDYMLKHIAHVYNNDIDGQKVRESLGDIVVYSIIGMVMVDAWKELTQSQPFMEENTGENPAPEESCYRCDMAEGKNKDCTVAVVEMTRETLDGMNEEDFIGLCKEVFKGIKGK